MRDNVETHRFEAEVSRVLRLVINSLYSNKDIFSRELISNASDALDKLKYEALTNHELLGDTPLEIRVSVDSEAGTLTIDDTGIGMSHDELIENLGTVAHSGSGAFLEALEAAQGQSGDSPQLIGQFGVGFYSAYLVADRVDVISKAAGADEAWKWSSDAGDGYTVEPTERDRRGTAIVLHLKDDQKDYLQSWTLKELITRYSDYISHPILVESETYVPSEEEGAEPTVTTEFKQVNRAKALWQRSKSEVTDEEYDEFYKHLTHDWEPPLARVHFRVEGMQMFDGVLFAPSRPPFDLYAHEQSHGIRLYVKRVFIMDDVKELLPTFLRFIRGVVDSDDLPLNVSRELLQDSKTVGFIKKQVAKKALDMLDGLAHGDDPSKYIDLWTKYGAVLKEGLHAAPEHKKRLAKLVRYKSSKGAGDWVSLADYRGRMAEDQKAIYYIIAETMRGAERSPHLEALHKKGYEVLYMTDPIDEWAVQGLGEYDEMPFVSAMKADLSLDAGESDEAKEQKKALGDSLAPLIERFKSVLDGEIQEVALSSRLTDSPVCLVVPDGGVHAHMERLLKASQPGFEGTKKILEINGEHPLIKNLAALTVSEGPGSDGSDGQSDKGQQIDEWIHVLFGQALLTEGSRLDDPSAFAASVTRLLESVSSTAAGA